jgi:hypothetical protein
MRKSKFSESQIAEILKEAEAGMTARVIDSEHARSPPVWTLKT